MQKQAAGNNTHRVKTMLDELFKGNAEKEFHDTLSGWLMDEDNMQEKEYQLVAKFDSFCTPKAIPSKNATNSYLVFARKYGLKIPAHLKTLLRRHLIFKVAAVLALFLTISGGVYLLVERVEDTVGPNRITTTTVPVPADNRQQADKEELQAITENGVYLLPDNSIVRLSENSTINYCETFAEDRHVELRGEARFNVRKAENAADHFTVHTEHFAITVLGTQFNVHSPVGETFSTIDLYHGSVEVSVGGKIVAMKPTDHLRYDHITKETTLTTIPYTELRYDEMPGLVFEDALLTEVLKKIESEYNIRFIIDGEIPADQMRIRGSLSHLQSLGGLMKTFQMMSGRFDYEITDNKIKIYNIR